MKNSKQKININDFSKHLFWDIDRTKLDFEKDIKTIIQKSSYQDLFLW